MTSPSSSLFLVLLVVLSHHFTHQSYAMRKLQGSEIEKEREPLMDLAQKSSVEGDGDDIQRKELHEVHSGPNPISNSIPRQRWKTKIERKP